jgi:hypothetical protein
MYHVTCAGGYALPIKTGRFEVLGYSCPVNDPTAVSQITLIDGDDFKPVTDSSENRTFVEKKGVANVNGNLEAWFPEPIKLRKGITLAVATNLKVGKMMVYAR